MRGGRLVAAALVLLAVAGLGAWLLVPRAATRPNVLLLTIDTLRADHLGTYGARGNRTPNIDRLASEGTLFENAACPMPMTRPSLSSIHTSRHPRTNGVVNNAVDLPEDAVTLAEVFRDAGYDTAASVGVRLLEVDSGFAQGFSSYDGPESKQHIRASRVLEPALEWLASRDADEPFFLWIHLFDPHLPYAPPSEFLEGGTDAERLDKLSWAMIVASAEENGGDVPERLLDRGLELYAAEVAYVDHSVGKLVATLDEQGLLDDTILAFTADHGECFDHGIFFEHADCLYEGAVHVPLFFRAPGRVREGVRVETQVQHPDVAPTILALAGIEAPSAFEGRSLFPLGAPDPDAYALVQHPLYDEKAAVNRGKKQRVIQSVGGRPTRPILVDKPSEALRGARWKLIVTGDEQELYDIAADPAESENLASTRPEERARLQALLGEQIARLPLATRAPSVINARLRETLRALGYAD